MIHKLDKNRNPRPVVVETTTTRGKRVSLHVHSSENGSLPVKVVETVKKTEYGFECDVRDVKAKEQAELEARFPKPSKLPIYERSGEMRYIETQEPEVTEDFDNWLAENEPSQEVAL